MNEQLITPLIGIIVTAVLSVWRLGPIRDKAFAWVGKLPRRAQWIAPLVLAMLATTGEGYLDGLTGEDLLEHGAAAGGEAGVLAIGFWHVLKRFFAEGAPTVSGASALLLVGVLGFGHVGCAGTFEEAKMAGAKARRASPPATASTQERCVSLSDRARLEGAIAKGGAVLTGATGISTWPVDGDARTALAITSGFLAAGTATVVYLYETDAASYVSEGCAAK